MKLRRESLPDWAPALLLVPTDVAGIAVQLAAPDRDVDPSAQVTLSGRAHDLLLALWGRQGLDRIQIQGDADLAAALLGSGITP